MWLEGKEVKKNCRTSLSWLLLTAFFLAVLASGCAGWKKKEPEPTPQVLFDKGMKFFNKKKYEKAAETFRKFKEEFPLSDYTPLAELRTADSYFLNKNYAEAIVLYEEFKKLHPMHLEIPYVIYQLGMCHYKQMRTVDRDQTETEKAIEQFRYLVENFPQSTHTAEARTKMQICQKQMADYEFYVGHFYFRVKRYKAALGRFERILQKYPESGLEGKIKPLMAECQLGIAKQEQKRKEKEAREEKKRKEREKKKAKEIVANSG